MGKRTRNGLKRIEKKLQAVLELITSKKIGLAQFDLDPADYQEIESTVDCLQEMVEETRDFLEEVREEELEDDGGWN